MENAEEILQCLDEFSKVKPKDIPRELEEYLCFVAKTGDPIYQWPLIKCLFREKLINVITDFYETCPSVEIPPCPNVDAFNYDSMKNFILEKLDTFAAAPFTVQRICELLTTPRKEYNRIDKYMRALEKNILVVSTREPGNRRNTENGESVVNGLESEHVTQGIINSDINVEVDMDDGTVWPKTTYNVQEQPNLLDESPTNKVQENFAPEQKDTDTSACRSSLDTVITSRPVNYMNYTQTESITATSETSTVETTTVLTTPTDNITVTITNVTEEEINHLTEQEQQAQTEGEPPIYVSSINHKDTSIYLGTNENGDQVYRIKYEPYVEIDYMALPETAFQSESETVYDNNTIKPETTQDVIQTNVQSEPEQQPTETQSEPQSSTEPQSEIEKPTVTQPQTEITIKEKENWQVTNSTDSVISSSDEITQPQEPTVTEAIVEESKTTEENQVTESNIESDCSVSQTEETTETPEIQDEDVTKSDSVIEAKPLVKLAAAEETPSPSLTPSVEESPIEVTQSVECVEVESDVTTAETTIDQTDSNVEMQISEDSDTSEVAVVVESVVAQEDITENEAISQPPLIESSIPEPPFEPMELDEEIIVSGSQIENQESVVSQTDDNMTNENNINN